MKRHLYISLLFFFVTFYPGYGQSINLLNKAGKTSNDSIVFLQIKTDSIYNSNQIISLLMLDKSLLNKYMVKFTYNNLDLKKTSSFGESENAIAALNGSYFNRDKGGSVTYFEINDSVISFSGGSDLKWRMDDSITNGALVITKNNRLIIQQAKSDRFYETSKQESAVLISGPLLILNSMLMKLPDLKFVNKRHPRTCFCKTNESLVFITIDGRRKKANGMNLFETQKFLQSIGCTDAINLDGGGSTTMWIKGKGIVNYPSDLSGERLVSNAILIVNKH